MKKTKLKQTNERKDLDLYLKIALFVFFMSIFLLLILVIHNEAVKIGIEQGRMEGMDGAEANCLRFLCEKINCSSFEHVEQTHAYCKSLIYGTDFYLKFR